MRIVMVLWLLLLLFMVFYQSTFLRPLGRKQFLTFIYAPLCCKVLVGVVVYVFLGVLPESVCSFLLHPFAYLVEPTITKLTKTSTSPKSNTGIEYYTSFCQKFSFFSITVMQLNVENLSGALHDSVYTYIFLNYHLFGRLYIFTDSDGKLKKEIDNEDTSLDKTKYFYKTAEESK